jgi:sugar/nucleoside kinase (ribokinase family)
MTENLIIGNYNLDMVFYPVNLLPAWGEERTCEIRLVRAAGSAGYAAITLGKLGMPVTALGNIGNDSFGSLMLNALHQAGVDTRYVHREEAPTGASVTLTNERGDRAFVTHCGHLDRLGADRIVTDIQLVPHAGFCLLAGYFLLRNLGPDGAISVLQACKERGGTTMFDTGWDPQGWPPETVASLYRVLAQVDVFFPNFDEAVALTGETSIEKAARQLLALGPRTVVVKNGEAGSLWASREGCLIPQEAIPVQVFDTTGAGDAFNAGVIYGLSIGWRPERILRFASAVAALTISRQEDREPTVEEVSRLLRERGLE